MPEARTPWADVVDTSDESESLSGFEFAASGSAPAASAATGADRWPVHPVKAEKLLEGVLVIDSFGKVQSNRKGQYCHGAGLKDVRHPKC